MSSRLAAFLRLAFVLGAIIASTICTETPASVAGASSTCSVAPTPASSGPAAPPASSSIPTSTSATSPPLATATLDKAQVIGIVDGAVTSFWGIPFAEPPGRPAPAPPVAGYTGTLDATQPAAQCVQLVPQLRTDMPPEMLADVLADVGGLAACGAGAQSEDCLTVNVLVPTGTMAGDGLPVIAFVFGGGFVLGSNEQMPGDAVVARSVELGQPVCVAMNHRLHAFGFLGGKEVKEAGVGNLGLQDQREALRWIQKHIAAFDRGYWKVTLWGPSSGAISSALQMLTNHGDPASLFRAAVMSAGSPLPTGDIGELQPFYDQVVDAAGCAGTSDTLACLRQISADALAAAATTVPSLFVYSGLATPWAPRVDGAFLPAPPQHLVLTGQVADVPFITGDALDEGTIFATGSWNVTYVAPSRIQVDYLMNP